MAFRIDTVRIEIEGAQEFEGHMLIRFELPPNDPLVALLLEWNEARLTALAKAAGDQFDLLRG